MLGSVTSPKGCCNAAAGVPRSIPAVSRCSPRPVTSGRCWCCWRCASTTSPATRLAASSRASTATASRSSSCRTTAPSRRTRRRDCCWAPTTTSASRSRAASSSPVSSRCYGAWRRPSRATGRAPGRAHRPRARGAPAARRGLDQPIAQRLVISPKTVGKHLEHILEELPARSRAEAVAIAYQRNLHAPPDNLIRLRPDR